MTWELLLSLVACALIAWFAVIVARRNSYFALALGIVAAAFPMALAVDWGCVALDAAAAATGHAALACDLEGAFRLNDSFAGLGLFAVTMIAEATVVMLWAKLLTLYTGLWFAYPAIGVLVSFWTRQARMRKARRSVRKDVRRNASGVIVNFAPRRA